LQAFDPLDRPIPNEDNDQMMKRDDLVQAIDGMTPVGGYVLNAPMSNENYDKLENMFAEEEKHCIEIGERFQQTAQEKGQDFTDKYEEEPKVKSLLKVMKFFAENQMLPSAEVNLIRFEAQIAKTVKLIKMNKDFQKQSNVGQYVTKMIRDIFKRKREKKYTQLVKILIEVQKYLDENDKDLAGVVDPTREEEIKN